MSASWRVEGSGGGRQEEVLRFWFEEAGGAKADEERVKFWFHGAEETDRLIRSKFEQDVERAGEGELNHWRKTPRGRLALILLLDQFPRNIYRDTPGAFACDPEAQKLCLDGLKEHADRQLGFFERAFFYLPLEHSEDPDLQDLSVECFQNLAEEVGAELKPRFEGFLDYAFRHRVVIQRFGRFPHRNRVLGRDSTDEEVEFLKEGRPF